MGKKKKEEVAPNINILGFEIQKKYLPAVYRWAKDNPETLTATVKSMVRKEGWELNADNASSMIGLLESDLG